MTTDDERRKAGILAALRQNISEIEAGTEHIAEAAELARSNAHDELRRPPPPAPHSEWTATNYPGIPEGDDWLEKLPTDSTDERLIRDLAAVGVRCHSLSPLSNYVPTMPTAIPVLVDWLNNLDAKIPGPDTRGKRGIRTGLLRNLIDPAAYGDRAAISAIFTQLRREPPLSSGDQWWAGEALDVIAGPESYPEILALFAELTDDSPRAALLPYLGRSKSPEAIRIAVGELEHPGTRQYAIQALILAEADGTLPLIARYADDPNEQVRDWVRRAMEQLE